MPGPSVATAGVGSQLLQELPMDIAAVCWDEAQGPHAWSVLQQAACQCFFTSVNSKYA